MSISFSEYLVNDHNKSFMTTLIENLKFLEQVNIPDKNNNSNVYDI